MRLEDYVEKLFLQEYSHQVKAIFVEQLELLEYEFKDKVFTYLGFDPKSCERISLKSKLIASALKEAEGFERFRDRGDDFSGLAESVWKEANGDKKIAYKEYLNLFLDDVREEFEYEVDFDEQDDAAWEEYLENYDYDNTDCQNLIRSKLGLSNSDWLKVLGDGGIDTIIDAAMSLDQSYCRTYLMNELLNKLGLFDYDPDEEYAHIRYRENRYQGPIDADFENLEEYFVRKYINSEFINEIGLYVEDVKYVFNASVYTPQTTLLKAQQLKDVLVELKDKVSKITIEPSLIDNPKVTFASTVEDADFKAMKDAKTLGLHTALVDAEFENLDIRSEFAPCVDTVYFGNSLGSVQGSIRFPKFNGEFVLLSNENLKWYLGAMYLEEQGDFAYFRNRVYVGYAANLYITDFEAGSKATFTIGLYEGEGTFDFRLNALTSVKLGFTPIGKVNQYGSPVNNEVVYSVDTSSKVDIDLDSFFENCYSGSRKVGYPIFVGLYIEEIKNLILRDEDSIFFKDHNFFSLKGFFPSQFDPNQTTVLVVPKSKSPLYWRLFTNSRRDVKFDILYYPDAPESFGKSHLVFEHIKGNKTNQYVLNPLYPSRTDQRGRYFENRAVFYDSDSDFQGCVLYKCYFVNSAAPTGTIAFKPIHSNYDLVLQEATSNT